MIKPRALGVRTIRRKHPALLLMVLSCIAVVISSCGRSSEPLRPELSPRDPRSAAVARSYGWRAMAAHPQPQWHPSENMIAVRARSGIGVLQEGPGGEQYVPLRGGQAFWDPQWWGDSRIVYGPHWRPTERTVQFELPMGGLVVAQVGMAGITDLADLWDKGYAPRRASGQNLFAQYGEDLLLLTRDAEGKLTESYYGKGFFPTAERFGPGVAYQITPYPYRDFWSGSPGAGELVIRWSPGVVDTVDQGYGAAWTNDGRVLATVVQAAPGGRQDVVMVEGPGQPVKVLASGAHSPAPHPRFELAAVADAEDGIRLVSYDRLVDVRLARRGGNPQWNHDGTRLLIEEQRDDGFPQLRVLVLVWREQADPEE